MHNKPPLLSIVVPNYNHAPFLATALHSILEQDFTDFEVIVIDDGSTDNSLSVIDQFRARDSRIIFIQHPKNLGIYLSLNEGLGLARGTYIHFLSADDYYRPGFLSACMDLLLKYPEVGICACDIYSFTDTSPELKPIHYVPKANNPQAYSPQSLASIFQSTALRLGGRNTVLKTDLLRKRHGFNQKFYVACDWYVLTKIALTQGLLYVPKPLICWRDTPTCLTEQALNNKKLKRELYANLLDDLAQEEALLFNQFKRSGELGCVLKYAPFELLKRPKFWPFIPNILKRFLLRI